VASGKIKSLVRDRGFGFINPDSGGSEDVFFHSSSLTGGLSFDSLREGQVVQFDLEADPRNPRRNRAANVRSE
jgi:cold shock CspA family protein